MSAATDAMRDAIESAVKSIVRAMNFTGIQLGGTDDDVTLGDNDEIRFAYDSTLGTLRGPTNSSGGTAHMWTNSAGPWSLARDVFVDKIDFTSSDWISGNWTETDIQGANTVALADEKDGWITLTTAGADDDAVQIVETKGTIKLEATKDARVEFRVKCDEATQVDLFVGLVDSDATNALTDDDRLGFQKDDGDVNWDIVAEKNGAELKADSSQNIAADTADKLGIFWDSSASTVYFYINDTQVGSTTTNIPNDEVLSAVLLVQAGEVAVKVLKCDYRMVNCDRT